MDEFWNILVQYYTNRDGYEGDILLIYKYDDGRFGYLCIGYGSFSGCDLLQRCESFEDIDKLINELYNQIRYFEDKEELLNFLKNHDWEGDHLSEHGCHFLKLYLRK